MKKYAIRCKVQYITVVEAESKEAAAAVAAHLEFSKWDDYPGAIRVVAMEEGNNYWEQEGEKHHGGKNNE